MPTDRRPLFLDPCELQTIEMTAMPTDPYVRWQRLKCAVIMRDLIRGEAPRYLGVSYNHLREVVMGNRRGSVELQERIADLMDEEREGVSGEG